VATAGAVDIPVFVTVTECDGRRASTRWALGLVGAILVGGVALLSATAAVGWQARTSTEVHRAELRGVVERLDRIENKLDALQAARLCGP